MHLASARGLDACSVHVQNVPANMGGAWAWGGLSVGVGHFPPFLPAGSIPAQHGTPPINTQTINQPVDEVAYFFRDFRLNPDGIRPLPTEGERLAQEHLEQGGQDECVLRLFAFFAMCLATVEEAHAPIRLWT